MRPGPLQPFHLPASLCSRPVTALLRSYGGSDFCAAAYATLFRTDLFALCVGPSRPFRLQPSRSRHRQPLHVTLWLQWLSPPSRQGLDFAHRLGGSSRCETESSSPGHVSQYPCYGPVIHLLLLSTSHHCDAVAVGYGPENVCPERTCISLT